MPDSKPVILIGPFSNDPTESVSAVNRAFVEGLADEYRFVPFVAARQYGATRQGSFTWLNLYYLAKHWIGWMWRLARYRPAIAHYAICSGWALEKSLLYLLAARWFGTRTIGHLHGGGFLDHWRMLPEWRRRLVRHELLKLDGLILLSESWRKAMIELIGLNPQRLFVVNNPLARDFEEAALQMPIERKSNLIIALGVMERLKGVLDIVAAAALAQRKGEFRIQIIGPEREPGILARVQQEIARHSLSSIIEIVPGVWGREKQEVFRQASVLLLPSYFENFPLVVLEAAAAGVAIITTPVGAVPEFFANDVSALFVAPGDTDQIAAAILRLTRAPQDGCRLAQAARQTFTARLGRASIMSVLSRVYESLLRGTNFSPEENQLPYTVSESVTARLKRASSTQDKGP